MYKQVYVIYDDVITYDSFVWCILDHDMNHFSASSDLDDRYLWIWIFNDP